MSQFPEYQIATLRLKLERREKDIVNLRTRLDDVLNELDELYATVIDESKQCSDPQPLRDLLKDINYDRTVNPKSRNERKNKNYLR